MTQSGLLSTTAVFCSYQRIYVTYKFCIHNYIVSGPQTTFRVPEISAMLKQDSPLHFVSCMDLFLRVLSPSSPLSPPSCPLPLCPSAGNSGVGKTSLIVRVSQGQFAPVSSTLGLDFSTKTLTVGEERVIFQLWDTAGQER